MSELSNEPKLLPCPFCDDPMEDRGYGAIHAGTGNCPISGYAFDVTAWNTRQSRMSVGAVKGEAVAWLYDNSNGHRHVELAQWEPEPGWNEIPLYTSPSTSLSAHTEAMVNIKMASSRLLNNLWCGVASGTLSHEENWSNMEKSYPGSKDLHAALKEPGE